MADEVIYTVAEAFKWEDHEYAEWLARLLAKLEAQRG
jgi:hypothetical protein